MRLHRIWPQLSILVALIVGVSCTAGDLGPTEAAVPASESIGLRAPPGSIDTITIANLLLCSEQRYAKTTTQVGPKGARIRVGSHSLTIPAGALSQNVTIVAEQLTGSANSVRFSPEGLTFAVPAELVMSYENCQSVVQPKKVVYTDEQLKVLELLNSDDKARTQSVTSSIEHFSRYAVAY
ncbi:MAG TPA: hypothetical protein VFB61_16640 [Gemmatimonadales bacterium]|nr:hypothetical protein [Gemmatimonadales bacterium]